MPKNIFTPRNELVCGKLDSAETIAVSLENIELIDLLHDIRFDCERMEQKLISRKEEAKEQASIDEKKRPGKSRSTTKKQINWVRAVLHTKEIKDKLK